MSLTPGHRIGVYEVTAQIGEGGMGQVFRATDTKLKRQVAIKILPPSLATDSHRLARFQREAEVLASFNHPNIAAIYGFEESGGITALAMELVEGEDLSQRIARGAIPIDEALPIAKQISDALEAAHEQGIIHRDLKPANIKVRPDVTVKVLDFGLAKAMDPAASSATAMNSPTLSRHATQAGMILGTAAYMSPEQARGKTVDRRADIWAFGCVLYEMLSGHAAFARDTVADTLAAIVEREPDWAALPPSTPHSVRRLLERCLEKDPKRRLRDIADGQILMDVVPDSTKAAPRRGSRALSWAAVLAAIVSLAALAVTMTAVRSRASLPPWATEAVTISVDIPASTTLQTSPPAVSADGRQVAWVASSSDGRPRIWTETLGTSTPRDLPGTEGAGSPFWSPDGRSIGFLVQGQLKRIELASDAISSIAVAPSASSGATWSAENIIVFAARYAIFAVPASGGTPTQVAGLNRDQQENQLLWPQFLPDNRHFLYVARSGRPQKSGAYVGSLDGKTTRLFSTTSFIKYAPPGYLLFVREGVLVALPFDPPRLAVGTEATTIVQHIATGGGLNGRFDVSQNGLLAFFGQPSAPSQFLRWFDRAGNSLGDLTEPATYYNFRIAPDGQRVAVDRSGDDPTGGRSVWTYEGAGRPPRRITFGGIDEWAPVWSPDAESLTFLSYRDGPGDIYVKSLVTPAPEEPLIKDEEQKAPGDWSPDGRFLAYSIDRTDSRTDIWVLPVAPKGAPIPIARTPFNEDSPRFSPDGRFIAYESDETGQMEIYVQPFPPTGGKWQVSVNGGMDPVWRGRELLLSDRDRMLIAVPVTTSGSTFSAGRAVPLFKISTRSLIARGFDISPDGRRVLVRMQTAVTPQPMTIVLNWMARLKK